MMMKLRAAGLHLQQVGLLLLDRCTAALQLSVVVS